VATANIIMAVLFLLVIIFIIAQLILKPLKLIWKLVINSIIGLVLLMLTNFIGVYFDFSLPLNIITVLIAGFLGIPGIFLLICFQLLL
jgi:inhibitor of the pro-sigma K processing machinery